MSDNEVITRLTGPDRVRMRPAVIFGSKDREGVLNCVKSLCSVFFVEARLTFSQEMRITISKDNEVEIRSFDRGLILDDTIINSKPAWYWIFCDFFPSPREAGLKLSEECRQNYVSLFGEFEGDTGELHLPYMEFCFVQFASEYMYVESVRDFAVRSLRFRKGYPDGELSKGVSGCDNYTLIRFRADKEVFDNLDFSSDELGKYLEKKCSECENFRCELRDERGENVKIVTFCSN